MKALEIVQRGNGVGRPPHVPTDETRAQVHALAACGTRQDNIGRFIGISHITLRKHYADELETAAIKANAEVARSLFDKATKGDGASSVTAAIFWLKARAGWKECVAVETRAPSPTIDVSIYTPEERSQLRRLMEKAAAAQGGGD